jgi:hypothetical protein
MGRLAPAQNQGILLKRRRGRRCNEVEALLQQSVKALKTANILGYTEFSTTKETVGPAGTCLQCSVEFGCDKRLACGFEELVVMRLVARAKGYMSPDKKFGAA